MLDTWPSVVVRGGGGGGGGVLQCPWLSTRQGGDHSREGQHGRAPSPTSFPTTDST